MWIGHGIAMEFDSANSNNNTRVYSAHLTTIDLVTLFSVLYECQWLSSFYDIIYWETISEYIHIIGPTEICAKKGAILRAANVDFVQIL